MTAHSEIPGPNDPGLTALVMLLRFNGVGADPAQIRHQCGTAAIGTSDMIRCAREFGVKVVVQSTKTPRPELMTRDDFDAVWDGRIVLMTRRANLVDLASRFYITWFIGAIHKYRHQLVEVLVASFFL